jgi:hypothetical protein
MMTLARALETAAEDEVGVRWATGIRPNNQRLSAYREGDQIWFQDPSTHDCWRGPEPLGYTWTPNRVAGRPPGAPEREKTRREETLWIRKYATDEHIDAILEHRDCLLAEKRQLLRRVETLEQVVRRARPLLERAAANNPGGEVQDGTFEIHLVLGACREAVPDLPDTGEWLR